MTEKNSNQNSTDSPSKTAFIAIVGCPNAGKSTILNRLVGEKIAIVSPKPQTTRTRIMGVLTKDNTQLVFTDTPGFHRPRTALGQNMMRAVDMSIGDVDSCLLVVEPNARRNRVTGISPAKSSSHDEVFDNENCIEPNARRNCVTGISPAKSSSRDEVFDNENCIEPNTHKNVDNDYEIRDEEMQLIDRFKREKIPAVLAINKIDTIENKEELLRIIEKYSSLYDFTAVVPVSAIDGNNMDVLLDELMALAFESEHFFPDDTLTDQPEKQIAAELIREKLLKSLDKEIPHGTAVSIEKFSERDDPNARRDAKTGSSAPKSNSHDKVEPNCSTDDGNVILDIEATIYCEKESHKGIIIGKGGSMLKRISTRARIDMEKFFGCRVNLHVWVKVKEDWRNREGLIRNFGLETK